MTREERIEAAIATKGRLVVEKLEAYTQEEWDSGIEFFDGQGELCFPVGLPPEYLPLLEAAPNLRDEVIALREQVERYEKTLRSIAKQWIGDEIVHEQIGGDPDYQAGYEGCVTTARAALAQIEKEPRNDAS